MRASCTLYRPIIHSIASEDDGSTKDSGCQLIDNADLLDIMDPPSDSRDGKYAAYGQLEARVVCLLYRNWVKRSSWGVVWALPVLTSHDSLTVDQTKVGIGKTNSGPNTAQQKRE